MKLITLIIALASLNVHADEGILPEIAHLEEYPVAHWQLTMVTREDLIDITGNGFEFISRVSCIEAGIERVSEALVKDEFGGISEWLGFACDYVTGEDE